MYAVGTSILYGRMGVCSIESIGEAPFQPDSGRSYYKLRAAFSSSGEMIYIPVDAAASMRPLINGGEAAGCLKRLPQLEPRICSSRRPADLAAHYQGLLASCELMDCLLLLKEIHCKRKDLASRGKKLGQVDFQYLKIAERLACEELAAALDATPEQMRERLYAAMDQPDAAP